MRVQGGKLGSWSVVCGLGMWDGVGGEAGG